MPELPLVSLPQPFRFGFAFDWMAFLPVALIYLISSIETVGDLTANCMLSRQPLEGPAYLQRLRGGVLGDGVSCLLAATFSAFPNTTFAQNNGVIQLTGVASRHVGIYIGGVLLALGLFPWVGAILQQIPKPVLGGATLVMFGSVAAAGIRILGQTPMDRRSVLIIAASFGVGLGVAAQPTLLDQMPAVVKTLFDSAITSGGITAILLNLLLPEERVAEAAQASAKGGALARWRKPLVDTGVCKFFRAWLVSRGRAGVSTRGSRRWKPAHDPDSARPRPGRPRQAGRAHPPEERGGDPRRGRGGVRPPRLQGHQHEHHRAERRPAQGQPALLLRQQAGPLHGGAEQHPRTLGQYLQHPRVDDDPAEALARYIRAKMEFSRRYPLASRIFAMEIISGGECLTAHFNQDYRSWFRGRAAVFEAWIAAGRMDPVDPVHLIFLLWGSTQHYADFASQIGLVTGRKRMSRQDFAAAADNLVRIILKGCGLTPPAA